METALNNAKRKIREYAKECEIKPERFFAWRIISELETELYD